MIKRSVVFIAAGMVVLLASGIAAYGYWTDQIKVRCEIPVAYQVEISVGEDGEGLEAGMGDMDLIMDLETEAEEETRAEIASGSDMRQGE